MKYLEIQIKEPFVFDIPEGTFVPLKVCIYIKIKWNLKNPNQKFWFFLYTFCKYFYLKLYNQ